MCAGRLKLTEALFDSQLGERICARRARLRGAATALALVCRHLAASRRRHHAAVIDAQLDRLRAGLSDLATAPAGDRPDVERGEVELSALSERRSAPWATPPSSGRGDRSRPGFDRRRFAQALGNVLATRRGHGFGPVRVIGRAMRGGVRVEFRDRDRGLESPGARRGAGCAPELRDRRRRHRGHARPAGAREGPPRRGLLLSLGRTCERGPRGLDGATSRAGVRGAGRPAVPVLVAARDLRAASAGARTCPGGPAGAGAVRTKGSAGVGR